MRLALLNQLARLGGPTESSIQYSWDLVLVRVGQKYLLGWRVTESTQDIIWSKCMQGYQALCMKTIPSDFAWAELLQLLYAN